MNRNEKGANREKENRGENLEDEEKHGSRKEKK